MIAVILLADGHPQSMVKRQAAALQRLLDKRHGVGRAKVLAGMKGEYPSLRDVFATVSTGSFEEVVALSLTPYYEKDAMETYETAFVEAGIPVTVRFVEHWHESQRLIQSIVVFVKGLLANGAEDRSLIFVGEESLDGRQLRETAQKVADYFPGLRWEFAERVADGVNALVCRLGAIAESTHPLFIEALADTVARSGAVL